MKKLFSAVALATLFIAGSALAVPQQKTDNYYILSATKNALLFAPQDIEHKGNTASVWTITVLRNPDEHNAQVVWVLHNFDCVGRSDVAGSVYAVTLDGTVVERGQPQPVKINPDTVLAGLFSLACENSNPNGFETATANEVAAVSYAYIQGSLDSEFQKK